MKWISYMYTYIPSLLNLPSHPPSQPSMSSQSTELSSLCFIAASHWLSILHMVVCICESYSQFLLPSPSAVESVSLLSVSVSLFLSWKWVYFYHFSRFHVLQIDGETVETVADFNLGGSKITADGDCNHEIKRHLLVGKKVMTNLDSILKSRDITLPTKVHLVKAMVFPVVMYGCESWTIKKAEHWRIDAL